MALMKTLITEFCPHCQTEIEMLWDVKTMGYKAYCPVCGERLMLCDACQHNEDDEYLDDCDYDSCNDSCRYNKEVCENKDVSINLCGDSTVIVTENVDGEIYIITAKYLQDILDDWQGECNFIPENDARVFFAARNGKPINPYNYVNFETLLKCL